MECICVLYMYLRKVAVTSSRFFLAVFCPIVVAALTLSLRRQKRDTQSPVEDDEIRENIITYDDEGGGEADTAAFDIATLKSAPQSMRRAQRLRDNNNM